ncbi:hypothetical protein AXX17_AT5G33010 [Arabidopsis thaliana]|uniref:Uncharacterized protein n=1 Tax=Arabidopsis thaliana TaxID=3702 RepID=A0A178UJ64_ARATH|nr:hypothetical protein AXX17_AT5G33010 [Arabidopsis thaliana]
MQTPNCSEYSSRISTILYWCLTSSGVELFQFGDQFLYTVQISPVWGNILTQPPLPVFLPFKRWENMLT